MASKNNENIPYYINQQQHNTEYQYINLRNVPQDINKNNHQEVLSELKTLKDDIKQREEATQRLIQMLTEEVITLRHEVRQLKMRPGEDASLDLLPPLPFNTSASLNEFEEKMINDDMLKTQFKYFIDRIGGCDMRQFLKAALKATISDYLAVDLTWRGTVTKPSIQNYTVFKIMKDICHIKYKVASSYDINKLTQQHFHAKDRISSKQKRIN